MRPPTPPAAPERALRAVLLGILVLGMSGTLIELYLLEHTETMIQMIPVLGLVAGILTAVGAGLARSAGILRVLRGVMAGFVVAGGTGVLLHYKGNTEFELEMYPSMAGFELFKESMMGATPALAPGSMAWLGLIGLAYTYRHPLLRSGGSTQGDQT